MKFKRWMLLCVILIFTAGILAGCVTPYPTRNNGTQTRTVVPYTARNAPNNYTGTQTGTLPNTGLPSTGMSSGAAGRTAISATYEMVDFSTATIAPSGCNARAWASAGAPVVEKLTAGQQVRVVGKLDGWYVAAMPGSKRLACLPAQSIRTNTGVTNPGSTPSGPPTSGRTTPMGGTTPGTTTGTTTPGTTSPYGSASVPKAPATAGTSAYATDESRILQLCNAERAKVGAKPLVANTQLTSLARMKSQDMVNKNYFSHQSPTYGSPFDMLKTYGVRYMYAGENIAMNQSAEAAFRAWMNSEGHRKNILNPNFTDLGVGIASKGGSSYIYTQQFIGK